MNFSSRSFILFFYVVAYFDFIDHGMVMKSKFKKFEEINLEKIKKFYRYFTKTFGEINFFKKKNFTEILQKTLIFIILHAKEQLWPKIFMLRSMKFKYKEGYFEEGNSSNNSFLGLC